MISIRNSVLKDVNTLEIAGKEYKPKYDECKEGFIEMSTSHTNTGIILVPDSCNLTDDMKEETFLAANYNVTSDEEKERLRKIL